MRKKLNKVKQKVAELLYRDSANYKTCMTVLIPPDLKIKVGDDVDVSKFGIDREEWFKRILPNNMMGFKFDEELDHTIVEIQEIRDRRHSDVCVNTDETDV